MRGDLGNQNDFLVLLESPAGMLVVLLCLLFFLVGKKGMTVRIYHF